MLHRDWEPGHATIVAVRFEMTGFGGSTGSRAVFIADVQPDAGAPAFRATFNGPRRSYNFLTPGAGDVVPVEFRAASGEVRIDTSNPVFRRDVAGDLEEQRFDALMNAGPGKATPPVPSTPDISEVQSAVADVSAAVARITATTGDTAGTIAAIKRARAAGDLAEVERLKAEFKRRSDEARGAAAQASGAVATGRAGADPLDRLQKLADLHDRGVLTDDEFAVAKRKILSDG